VVRENINLLPLLSALQTHNLEAAFLIFALIGFATASANVRILAACSDPLPKNEE